MAFGRTQGSCVRKSLEWPALLQKSRDDDESKGNSIHPVIIMLSMLGAIVSLPRR